MNEPLSPHITVLAAEDDCDDRLMIKRAFKKCGLPAPLFVHDGEELLDFLHLNGKFADQEANIPDLIMLDLNMPNKGGQATLESLKKDLRFRHIPVIMLSTSADERDITRSYDEGASSYIVKPSTFSQLIDITAGIKTYWFQTVRLPPIL